MIEESDAITAHIRAKLEPLIPEPIRRESATADLRKALEFLNWKPPPGANFYDFTGKVELLFKRFANEGFNRDDFVKLVNKYPYILASNPETLIHNVETVANHFSSKGLSVKKYVACGMATPSLFSMKPATVIDQVNEVIGHFAADGLVAHDYIRAATGQPSLFSTKPETVIARLEGVLSHFPGESRRKKYIDISIKSPTLFCRSGEAIGRNLNIISNLLDRKLVGFRAGKHDGIEACDLALKYPHLLYYSEDNLLSRELISVLNGNKINSLTILKSRPAIEREIHAILGNPEPTSPVIKIDASNDLSNHARNLLLRALIHEGLIGGRNA